MISFYVESFLKKLIDEENRLGVANVGEEWEKWVEVKMQKFDTFT